jgi:protein SCO1/2
MKKTLLIVALALPFVTLGTRLALRPQTVDQGLRSGTFDPPREAPGFTLDGSNGRKVALHDYLGKVTILEFGYTYCEEVCPVTLAHLTEALRKLGNAAGDIQLSYVSRIPI